MIGWALASLVIAFVAGTLGFMGIAGAAVNVAWLLFVLGVIAAVVMLLTVSQRPTV